MKFKVLVGIAALIAAPLLHAKIDLDFIVYREGSSSPKVLIDSACDNLPKPDADALEDAYMALVDATRSSGLTTEQNYDLQRCILNGKTVRQIIIEGSLLQLRALRMDDLTRSSPDAALSAKIAALQERLKRYGTSPKSQ